MTNDNPSQGKYIKNQLSRIKLPVIIITVSFLSLLLGHVPIIGILSVIIAPSILVIGASLLFTILISPERSLLIPSVAFILFYFILGVNTRIPDIYFDYLHNEVETNINKKISLSVGDAIRLDSNVTELSARNVKYAGVSPRTNEGFGVVITGYSPPATYLSSQYWHEDPAQSIKSLGYSLASLDQKAPTLRLRAKEDGLLLVINLELLDETGELVASESRIYRNGFRFESRDLGNNSKSELSSLWPFEYMVHGNFISSIIRNNMGRSQPSPVGYFLNSAIQRYVQQDDPKFTQLVEPIIDSDVEFDPPKKYSDEAWSKKFYDKNRSETCKAVIEPELGNINVPDFTVDPGLKGMSDSRRPYKFIHGRHGNEKILLHSLAINETLCDGYYLYQISTRDNHSIHEISKYKYDGTFIYRFAFKKPLDNKLSLSGINKPSLNETDGQLRFEYINHNNGSSNNGIIRIREMRINTLQ